MEYPAPLLFHVSCRGEVCNPKLVEEIVSDTVTSPPSECLFSAALTSANKEASSFQPEDFNEFLCFHKWINDLQSLFTVLRYTSKLNPDSKYKHSRVLE